MECDRSIRKGEWKRFIGPTIWHKTIGVIGLGRIGKKLVQALKGFDMKVYAYDIYHDNRFASEHGVTYCDTIEEMLPKCDILCLHTNLTDETRNMIDLNKMKMMKPTAVIVNTSRGGVINENDLAYALSNSIISAAALDVFEVEPPGRDHPFLKLENVILSGHNAGSSAEGKNKLIEMAFQNVIDMDNGKKPEGLLNPEVLSK
jgi:phosphoglycerate dehydrogenase-like enzyme